MARPGLVLVFVGSVLVLAAAMGAILLSNQAPADELSVPPELSLSHTTTKLPWPSMAAAGTLWSSGVCVLIWNCGPLGETWAATPLAPPSRTTATAAASVQRVRMIDSSSAP